MSIDELFSKIALEYNLTIIQVEKNDEHCIANGIDNYINRSYIAGRDVYLGIYNNEELKVASLFHELGHTLIEKDFINEFTSVYEIEKRAWDLGFLVADMYDVMFTNETYDWCLKQLNTYIDWEKREMRAENYEEWLKKKNHENKNNTPQVSSMPA